MAYSINKSDGTVVATVADGTLDTTSSSLSLIGKNYAGYGEVLNENQIKIIESFANTSSNIPTAPLKGQVWYNTTANQLQVYNGSTFKSVSNPSCSGCIKPIASSTKSALRTKSLFSFSWNVGLPWFC